MLKKMMGMGNILPEFHNSVHSAISYRIVSTNTRVGHVRQYTYISGLVKTPEMLKRAIDVSSYFFTQ